MPIQALTGTTVAKLRSAQVITDSVSVVKELIDNALDAKADNIVIIVSHDLVTSIKVTDNGHGIAPEDRPYIGKRNHTSKIRFLDDLESIGGASLGFRGEALASIAQLCEKGLGITTRVDRDSVGEKLMIDTKGNLTKIEKASAGVGTVILAQDFLKAVPVRYKLAKKHASRDLIRLKEVVRSYALARPAIRLQLRSTGSTQTDPGISYTPSRAEPPSLTTAALALFGSSFRSSCISVLWPPEVAEPKLLGSKPVVQALLIDPGKLNGVSGVIKGPGQFLALDGRPISVARGVGQDIVKLYRAALTTATGLKSGLGMAFMAMNISCPPTSYDINIEPAKDDVAFTDTSVVMKLLESMLSHIYDGHENLEDNHTCNSSDDDDGTTQEERDLPPGFGRREVSGGRSSISSGRSKQRPEIPGLARGNAEGGTMEGSGQEESCSLLGDSCNRYAREKARIPRRRCEPASFDDELPELSTKHPRHQARGRGPATITNPWTLAQLNRPPVPRRTIPESSDALPGHPDLEGQHQLPPTPPSLQISPAQDDGPSFTSRDLPLSSPTPQRRATYKQSQPLQRQLVFHPAGQSNRSQSPLKSDQQQASNNNISLDQWLTSNTDTPARAQTSTPPGQLPGFSSNGNACTQQNARTPMSRRQRSLKPESSLRVRLDLVPSQRGSSLDERESDRAAPFRTVVPRQSQLGFGQRQTRRGGREQSATFQRSIDPPVETTINTSGAQGNLPLGAQHSTAQIRAFSGAAPNFDQSDPVYEQGVPVQQVVLRRELDFPMPSSDASLLYRPTLSCSHLVFRSDSTPASIAACAATIHADQTFRLQPEEQAREEADSLAFLDATGDDAEHWDQAIRRQLIAVTVTDAGSALASFELGIEEALSKYCWRVKEHVGQDAATVFRGSPVERD